MRRNKIFFLFFSLALLAAPRAVRAGDLVFVQLDYGVPNSPNFGSPVPGEAAAAYFTLKNTTNFTMNNIVLVAEAGKCVDSALPELRLGRLAAQESARITSSLALKISANCRRGDSASLLLLGAYSDPQGVRRSVWLVADFQSR